MPIRSWTSTGLWNTPKNIDGYRLSNYMNKDRNGKLKMEPIWDWDLSWGNANYADGGHTNGWYDTRRDDIWLGKTAHRPGFLSEDHRPLGRFAAGRVQCHQPACPH